MILLDQLFGGLKGQIKTYEPNRGMKYQKKSTSLRLCRALEEKHLNRVYQLLRQCQIKCFKVLYKGSTIGLVESLTVEAALRYLNLGDCDQSTKKHFSIG